MPTAARVVPVLTVGLLILTGSGCAATDAGRSPMVSSSPTAPAPTSSRPTPAPVRTTPPPPTAADGTDLAACADGACEVRIDGPAEIPVPHRGGLREVRVERADPGMRLVVLGASGVVMRIAGGGRSTLREGAVVEMRDIGGDSVIVTVTVP